MNTETLAVFSELKISDRFIRELRSDHAGETGAVFIYRGILWMARSASIRSFAKAHLATECTHLQFFNNWLPKSKQSKLIPLWKLSGFILGLIAALGGQQFTYATIKAVETFVDEHYQQQIDYLRIDGTTDERQLLPSLIAFQADERDHKNEAMGEIKASDGFIRIWEKVITEGSKLAVTAARHV